MFFQPLRALRVPAAFSFAPLLGMTVLVSLPLAAQAKNPEVTVELEQKDRELLEREAALLKQLGETEAGRKLPAATIDQTDQSGFESESGSAPKIVTARAIPPGAAQAQAAPKIDQAAEISQLRDQLAEKDKRIDTLVQELGQSRNRLLLAETEVERLSAIIQERNRKQLTSIAPSTASLSVNPATKAVTTQKPASRAPAPRAAAEPDMQIITVSADKAHLRTGPGTNNSPLMTVSRGTRLAVETRQGDWYRVISPAGTRAWVSSDVVMFGELSGTARSTRMGGYDSGAESRAFDLINQKN